MTSYVHYKLITVSASGDRSQGTRGQKWKGDLFFPIQSFEPFMFHNHVHALFKTKERSTMRKALEYARYFKDIYGGTVNLLHESLHISKMPQVYLHFFPLYHQKKRNVVCGIILNFDNVWWPTWLVPQTAQTGQSSVIQ